MPTTTLSPRPHVTERHKVAHHEAGHALAFVLTGAPFRYATIAARDVGGQIANARYPQRPVWNKVIALHAAGAIAESLINDNRYEITDAAAEDLKDMRGAARYTWHLARQQPDHTWTAGLPENLTVHDIAEMGWATACDLILTNYGSVRAVADALVNSRHALTRTQIRHIIETAPPAAPPNIPDDIRTLWPTRYKSRLKWTPGPSRKSR